MPSLRRPLHPRITARAASGAPRAVLAVAVSACSESAWAAGYAGPHPAWIAAGAALVVAGAALAWGWRAQRLSRAPSSSGADAQARFDLVLEAAPMALALISIEEGEPIAANSRARALFGMAPAAPIPAAQSVYEDPEDRSRLLKRLRSDGQVRDLELWLHPAGAGRRRVIVNCDPVRYGTRPVLLASFTDVTERFDAEAALASSNQFLNALIQSAPLAVYSVDQDGLLTSWNAQAQAIFGWHAIEVLGRRPPTVPQAKTPEFEAIVARAARGEGLGGVELERVRRDGSRILIRATTSVMRGPQGEPQGFVAFAHDITHEKELESQYQMVLHRSFDGFWIRTGDGTILDVNDAYCRMLGYSREEIVGHNVREFLVGTIWDDASAGEIPRSAFESTHRTKSGDLIALDASVNYVAEHGGRFYAFFRDIRERKAAQERLEASERRLRSMMARSSDALTVLDADLRFIFVSPPVEAMLGYQPADLLGTGTLDHVHPDDAADLRTIYTRVLAEPGAVQRAEFRFRHKSGVWRNMETIFTNALGDPSVGGVISNSRDITLRRRAEEKARALAMYDPLTGLPNRVLLADHTRQTIARAERAGRMVGFMFLDIDRFKNINDSLGHGQGDELLKSLTERLRGAIREGDMVARLGGDEFVIVLPDVKSPRACSKVAEKIIASAAEPFHSGGHELYLSTSIGISLYPEDGADPEALLKHADTAMYKAKEAGRNCFRFFSTEMTRAAEARLFIENDLRRALKTDELVLMFQPQFEVGREEGRRLTALEALVRWRHPERGLLGPGEFIPVAEETGLIVPLGEWVLRHACRQAADWKRTGLSVPGMVVNVSTLQLHQTDLPGTIRSVLAETGLAAADLELEITESAFMHQEEHSLATLDELHRLGVGLTIDDFGTGYSSLAYLKRMPVDKLKIDRVFVRDLGSHANMQSDNDDDAIVRATIALAKSLGLRVLGEGVETERQLAKLLQHGCREVQGFYFGQPLTAMEAAALIAHPNAQAHRAA
jgi:diguanylate cyclase (GGDEF)-like protein/PAS domain S-box-containing protein